MGGSEDATNVLDLCQGVKLTGQFLHVGTCGQSNEYDKYCVYQEIAVPDFNSARLRFLYDVTFFIIVTTIGLNIVFGIIVDTFSELRDEKVSKVTANRILTNSTNLVYG